MSHREHPACLTHAPALQQMSSGNTPSTPLRANNWERPEDGGGWHKERSGGGGGGVKSVSLLHYYSWLIQFLRQLVWVVLETVSMTVVLSCSQSSTQMVVQCWHQYFFQIHITCSLNSSEAVTGASRTNLWGPLKTAKWPWWFQNKRQIQEMHKYLY